MKRASVKRVLEHPQPDKFYLLVTREYPKQFRFKGLKLVETPINVWDRDLAPSWDLLKEYKRRVLAVGKAKAWKEYVERFKKEVPKELVKRKLMMHKKAAGEKEVVLVCTEEDWEYPYCHTFILLDMWKENPEFEEGIRPEVIPGVKARCLEKLKAGVLPEKIVLKFSDRVVEISFHPAAGTMFTRVDTIDWKGELHHFSSKEDSLTKKNIETVVEQVETADKIECKFAEKKPHWIFKDLEKKTTPLKGTLERWLEAARTKPVSEFFEEEAEAPFLERVERLKEVAEKIAPTTISWETLKKNYGLSFSDDERDRIKRYWIGRFPPNTEITIQWGITIPKPETRWSVWKGATNVTGCRFKTREEAEAYRQTKQYPENYYVLECP